MSEDSSKTPPGQGDSRNIVWRVLMGDLRDSSPSVVVPKHVVHPLPRKEAPKPPEPPAGGGVERRASPRFAAKVTKKRKMSRHLTGELVSPEKESLWAGPCVIHDISESGLQISLKSPISKGMNGMLNIILGSGNIPIKIGVVWVQNKYGRCFCGCRILEVSLDVRQRFKNYLSTLPAKSLTLGADKRANPRFSAQVIEEGESITFLSCHLSVTGGASRAVPGFVKDLSETGARVMVMEDLSKEPHVTLKADLSDIPALQQQNLNLRATVMWTLPRGPNQYEYGIRFVDLDPVQRKTLKSFLQILASGEA
ncbi:MAG: PilZ domain-containing protein [Armatimonadetes bacterium]|nr:PilZ domain-containing protein [Armatimonadota bacterium]